MSTFSLNFLFGTLAFVLLRATSSKAHMTAWHEAMYCLNGTSGTDNRNNGEPAVPLLDKEMYGDDGWWFNGKCATLNPPAPGKFLELPAGGSFTVEMAGNRAFTTLSYDGRLAADFGDGKNHTANYSAEEPGDEPFGSGGCIPSPNLHAKRESDAAGSVFAISYKSDPQEVTMEDLVVFTVKANTPFRRIATFDVPKLLPKCPDEGCTCAWGWVPNHCGLSNMYMNGYRCKVTNVSPNARPVAKARPPQWCEHDQSQCVSGPKQLVVFGQLEGNSVNVTGIRQADGLNAAPCYNHKMGFKDGAQNDIFVESTDTTQCVLKAAKQKQVLLHY